MSSKLKVGDLVTLNDTGLKSIYGHTAGLGPMKKVQMRITFVDPDSITHPEEIHMVNVDNEDINFFIIDDGDFDKVPA